MVEHSEYRPKVNDYVKWGNIEGWVYYADFDHITIEISVRQKHPEDLIHSPLHKKHHCLVVCNEYQWQSIFTQEDFVIRMISQKQRLTFVNENLFVYYSHGIMA